MNKIYTFLIALMVIPVMQINAQSNVTFIVDVTEFLVDNDLSETGIRIAGDFTDNGAPAVENWAPTAEGSAMTQIEGSNTWTKVVTFDAPVVGDTLRYKFANGDWGSNEGGATLEACGLDDGNGGFNRFLVLSDTDVTIEVCWDKCEPCVTSINKVAKAFSGVNIFPNPAKDIVNVNFTSTEAGKVSVEIYNTLGQRVAFEQLGFRTAGANTHQINLNGMNEGVYFVKINNGTNSIIQKLSVN